MKRFGNERTHLTLTDKAFDAYTNLDPLAIYEIEEEDGSYTYTMRGAYEQSGLTEDEVNEILEIEWCDQQDDDHWEEESKKLYDEGWTVEQADELEDAYGISKYEISFLSTFLMLQALREYQIAAKLVISMGLYKKALNLMDSELRDKVADAVAPCDDDWFLACYMAGHKSKFGEEFQVA